MNAVVLLLALAGSVPGAAPRCEDPPCRVTGGMLPGQKFHGRLGQTQVAMPRVAVDIEVDGRLNERAWQDAAMLTGFSQYSPIDRLPAADSTEVLVMYDERAIYFGIRAFEPHGPAIASRADRDRIDSDDHVQILLDTFDDHRRALTFAVNPFGVQSDGTFTDGAGADLSPDFVFESSGRVTDYGYDVEVRIPFRSLRYQQVAVQQWGINVIRRVQHSGHEQTWTPVERGQASFLAQSGTLTGLSSLRRGLVLDVNPVMTARADGAPASPTDPAWHYDRERPEFGGNIRWGVTPNLTMNAAVNPDFSQVEADVGQVTFDPRAALSFPEKRPFFLEGNEHFQSPNPLVYTRRIVAPEGAAKFTGKVGDLNVGMLSAVDDDGSTGYHPIYNILRLRSDLGEQSNVGVVYTDRVQGDSYNRVLGADTRLLVGGRYVFVGQVAGSMTRTGTEAARARPLFDLSLNRPGREWGFNIVAEGVHPGFVAGSGFIARQGIAHVNITPRRTFFPQNSVIESISFSPIIDGTWDWDRFTTGTFPNDIKLNTNTSASLRGGWRAGVYTWLESFKYPAQLYTNYYVERRDAAGAISDTVPYRGTDRLPNIGTMLSLNTPQFRRFSGSAQIIAGQDDNFDEWSSAWILFATLEADWRPTDRLRINGRYVQQKFNRKSDGSLVRLRTIPRLKVEYQVARPVFFRFVGQYDASRVDALRDDSRTNDPILIRRPDGSFQPALAQQRDGFRADWLFSYQPNPGTVFFAGYGTSLGSREFLQPRELDRMSDGFFLKLSWLFPL